MATKKVKTPEELAEEQRKKEEKMASYKKKAIQSIEEWLEKVRTEAWVIDTVQLAAHKGCATMGVNSHRDGYNGYY